MANKIRVTDVKLYSEGRLIGTVEDFEISEGSYFEATGIPSSMEPVEIPCTIEEYCLPMPWTPNPEDRN